MAIRRNGGVLFTIIRGDDTFYKIVFKDSAGNPVDITGWLFKTTIKQDTTLTDAEASYSFDYPAQSGADAVAGLFNLSIPSSVTETLEPKTYYFDIQLEQNGFINTPVYGKVQVLADVTQRTG